MMRPCESSNCFSMSKWCSRLQAFWHPQVGQGISLFKVELAGGELLCRGCLSLSSKSGRESPEQQQPCFPEPDGAGSAAAHLGALQGPAESDMENAAGRQYQLAL